MLTTGYCKLDRGILKYFKKPFSENEAWIWMITQADYNEGCKYAKIFTTLRQLALAWGRDKATVSRWLKKWADETNPRISCEYASFPYRSLHNNPATVAATVSATVAATVATCITLLNYKEHQTNKKRRATVAATVSATVAATLLNKEEINIKKKNLPDSNESASPNSQIYNFFIEKKREIHNRPDWLPTANQAKQLRANIKALLDQGYKADELVKWLGNFFTDPKMKASGYPWRFFMNEPIQWADKKEAEKPVIPAYKVLT